MATNVIEKLLVNIEANAAQLQAELAKGGKSVQDFGKQTDAIAKGADGIGQRYSAAAVQIASAAENMARAGKLGGDGLKQIIVQGSNMAFLFGPQGAIVGAVGIASLAIVEIFQRTASETRTVVEEVRRLAQAARDATSDAAGQRLVAIDQDIARIRGEIDKLEASRGKARYDISRAGIDFNVAKLQKELATAEQDRTLAQQQRQQETQRGQAEEYRNLQALVRANQASTQETAAAKAIETLLRNELKQTNLTLQRRVEILGLLGDLESKASAPKPPKAATEDSTAADVIAASKALDALKKKAADNADAVQEAVQSATRQLAALAGDSVGVLTLEIDALTKKFRALGASDGDITKIVAPLQAARDAATALNGAARTISIPESVRRELGLLPRELKDGTEGAATASRSLAAGFSDALDVALGIATAIDGASDSTTRLISAAAQAASGFAKLADLATQAGGISALFSTGAGLSQALPGIGAIVGGLASLVGMLGQEDPATKALREALDRNARRLEEFTSSVGELVQISISGADAAAVRGVATTRLREVGRDPQSDEPIFEEIKRSTKELIEDLRGAGVSLKELQQIAADFGVSFANADFPTADEIRALQLLISANGLKKLTDSLTGQLKLLALQARIDPDAFAGIAGVVKRIAVLTGEKGVPALAAALDGIDLSSADGPTKALESLKQLLADFTAGDIDLSALGGLSPDDFAETIASLIESIRSAAPTLRTPSEKFAAAIEAFGTAVELGTLTAEQQLEKAKDLFSTLFPDLAAGVDTSSAQGFKDSIKGIIDGFAADGDLSDAERAQIEVLRALLGAFEGATPAAEQLADALSVLADRFEIFGTSAADQITAILEEVTGDSSVGKNAGFALLKGLTDGLDLATDAGQADLRARAKAIFEQLSEGGITAEEQAVIDTIKRLLGLAGDVADEAARAAAEAIAEQERQDAERRRQRKGVLDGAENDIKLNDVTDPVEQLRIRVAALAKAFPAFGDVLADFDVSTQEGRDAMEAWIRSIAGSPEDLERLAAAMGITVDELLSALLGLEEGADSAAAKVATLADKLGAAFDTADFANELEGVTDPLEKLKRTSAAVGDVLPEISDIFKQFSLDTAQGRAGAEAALIALGKSTSDAAVRSAVLKLLAQIRGVPQPNSTLAGGSIGSASGDGRANVQAASSVTEVTANRMVDLLQRSVSTEEAILDTLRGSLSRSLSVPAAITPPALPSVLAGGFAGAGSGGAGGVVLNVTLPQIIFAGPVTTADPAELSRLVQQRFLEIVQGQLATDLLVALRRAGVARSN